jgi:hypothetical protein
MCSKSKACFHIGGAFCQTGVGRAPLAAIKKNAPLGARSNRKPGCFAYFDFSTHVWYLNTRVCISVRTVIMIFFVRERSITEIHKKYLPRHLQLKHKTCSSAPKVAAAAGVLCLRAAALVIKSLHHL